MAAVNSGKSYRFQSMEADEYLNILTDGNLANNTNVTTYGLDENDLGQVWQCVSYSYGSVSGMLMKSGKNTAFALDRYRGSSNYNNADIYTIGTTEADLKDQLVEFVPRAYGYYRIKLAYYDLYLTRSSASTYGGKNVVWRAQTGNMDQLWLAHEYAIDTDDSISLRSLINSYNQRPNYEEACAGICGCMAIKRDPDTLNYYDYLYPANWSGLAAIVSKQAYIIEAASIENLLPILRLGYPVIVRIRPESNPHWVIVYGYNGGDINSASSYLCIDPWGLNATDPCGRECSLDQSINYERVQKAVYFA